VRVVADVGLRVRLAAVDEAGLVRTIMLAAFGEYAGALAVESSALAESVEDVERAMQSGGAVLAFLGAEAVGSARFRPEADGMYVGRVAVLPAHRRQGVASALMRFLEDVALADGRRLIHVEVRDSLPGNVKLYQSLGYEVIAIEPHPRGPDRVWTMHKQLSDL
jgi:ribosomal protein S18 acetylase RimI-like enzyme